MDALLGTGGSDESAYTLAKINKCKDNGNLRGHRGELFNSQALGCSDAKGKGFPELGDSYGKSSGMRRGGVREGSGLGGDL